MIQESYLEEDNNLQNAVLFEGLVKILFGLSSKMPTGCL